MWIAGLTTTRRGFIRRTLTALMLSAAVLGASACGDDNNGSGPANITGTYTLRTIDGDNLPYTVTEDNEFFIEGEVYEEATLVLDSDRTFSVEFVYDDEFGDPQNDIIDGTWSRDGTRLTLSHAILGDADVTIDGNRIIIPADIFGLRLVFQK